MSLSRRLGMVSVVAVVSCVSVASAQDIVIEAGRGGHNADHYQEIKGQWIDCANPDTEKSGAAGLTPKTQCVPRRLPAGSAGEVRFVPQFSKAGHYFVYVTWGKAANSKQVIYLTRHGQSGSSRAAIQNGTGFHNPPNGDKWVYLGEFDFTRGDDQYVAIITDPTSTTSNDPGRPAYTYADAVRFSTKPLTLADGAELFPRDRVELRAMPPGSSIPAGAAPLLGAGGNSAMAASGGSDPAKKAAATPKPVNWNVQQLAAPKVPVATQASTAMAGTSVLAAGLPWLADLKTGTAQLAKEPRKRLLIYFHTPESLLCSTYDSDVFANPELSALLRSKYVLVKVELENAPDLANAMGVFRSGVFFVYDSKGQGVKKLEQRYTAADLLRELEF